MSEMGPPQRSYFSEQCRLWVILDRGCRVHLPAHFRFGPEATELFGGSEMT
jgi:hypothetical protein